MSRIILRPNYYSGISGLQIPIPKREFPEEFKSFSRLQYYATLFNSIEINSTFYRLPKASTVTKWAASVGENFRFTFKVWGDVTHAKPFAPDERHIVSFMESIAGANEKAGCLLVQFPPSLKPGSLALVSNLLTIIRRHDPENHWPIAVEFRDKAWFDEEVYEMLAAHDAGIVIHDKGRTATPLFDITADFVYLRFHGPSGDYRGSYANDFLYEYSGYINEWLLNGKKVYVYFNNTMGDSFKNLQTLNGLVI